MYNTKQQPFILRPLTNVWIKKMNVEMALSYDDISIRPQKSPVDSRSDVSLESTLIRDITVETPVISAPMDSVTESEMAQAMCDEGGVGIIHRYLSVDEQADEVAKVNGLVGATIGVTEGWRNRMQQMVDAGADFICVDVAHGHMQKTIDVVDEATDMFETPVMAGNVSTGDGAIDLAKAGAESIKVGVGPGSHCLTREVAGVGVPQATAVSSVSEDLKLAQAMGKFNQDVTVVADGGIQKPGDMTKALLLGADTVMVGGLLGGCKESPAPLIETDWGDKYKQTHGMASDEARKENDMDTKEAIEGASGMVRYSGPTSSILQELTSGARSGLSYVGAYDIQTGQQNVEFVRTTPSVAERNGTHGVFNQRD